MDREIEKKKFQKKLFYDFEQLLEKKFLELVKTDINFTKDDFLKLCSETYDLSYKRTPIESLDLGLSLTSKLKGLGYYYAEDFSFTTAGNISRTPGIGKKSFEKLKSALDSKGLKFYVYVHWKF